MGDAPLTIGEVINLLREEFPDVSVSKVRFLESQGLLNPGRSDGGYRLFETDDIKRIRFILRQQRDHFLPLKVIKSKLTLWERGEESDRVEVESERLLLDVGAPTTSVSRAELTRLSGLTSAQVDSLIDVGLVLPVGPDLFSPRSVEIASEARHLFAHGLEARHLRVIKHSAERQVDVLSQLTSALLRVKNAEAREQARNILAGCGDAMVAIHRAIIAEELHRLVDQ
ncbi:MAG: MerR family transcriptional regulator [Acidimicrobiia bacterium]|nr:MerR family transcriptional regulator [Acidimicrobiia bacterium]